MISGKPKSISLCEKTNFVEMIWPLTVVWMDVLRFYALFNSTSVI